MEVFSAAASLAVSDVCEVYAFSSVECVMSRKNQCASINPQMRNSTRAFALRLPSFDLERFRGNGRQLRIYGTHEGLATHIRLGPD